MCVIRRGICLYAISVLVILGVPLSSKGSFSQDKELTWLQIPDFGSNAVPAAQCFKMASYPPRLAPFAWHW